MNAYYNNMIARFVGQCQVGAKQTNQRTGQYLMNHLPDGAYRAVTGTLFDPFHRDLKPGDIYEWLENHLIFDDNESVIGVFNNNQLLWAAEGT